MFADLDQQQKYVKGLTLRQVFGNTEEKQLYQGLSRTLCLNSEAQ